MKIENIISSLAILIPIAVGFFGYCLRRVIQSETKQSTLEANQVNLKEQVSKQEARLHLFEERMIKQEDENEKKIGQLLVDVGIIKNAILRRND